MGGLITEKTEMFSSNFLKDFSLSQRYFQKFQSEPFQFEEAVNSWKDCLLMGTLGQALFKSTVLSTVLRVLSIVNSKLLLVRTLCMLLLQCLLFPLEIHISTYPSPCQFYFTHKFGFLWHNQKPFYYGFEMQR